MNKIDYKAELNPQQYEAVKNINGPQLVIAGAGSGKTRTLVYRVSYLVEQGVNPSSILLLTFTRKAAQEMIQRGSLILDKRCMNISGGTFHSFANLILRRYADLVGYTSSFSVIDRSDAEDIISITRAEMGLNKRDRDFPKKGTILNIISKSENTLRDYTSIIEEEYPQYECETEIIAKISKQYFEYKQKNNVMDYDDLLTKLLQLLKENEQVREHLSDAYKYIMVDEYQDSNRLQSQISCLLACRHGNLMVVGDDAQSIYSFRGANFRNIMDFPKIFDNCKITRLEQNYRSTQHILNFTNAVIANAKEKFTKNLFSDITGGKKPFYITPFDAYEQSRFIAQKVEKMHKDGKKFSDMAILFRSSYHSNEIEMELKSRNIPYEKFGGIKFTESAHIKDLTSLLRIIHNHMDFISWARVLKWFEGVGEKTAINIASAITEGGADYEALLDDKLQKKKYAGDLQRLYDILIEISRSDKNAIKSINKIVEYYTPYFEDLYDDHWKRQNDLESIAELTEKYDNLETFITDITLDPPQTSKVDDDDEEDKLVLSTIHSSKGLEWDTVFIIGVNNGYLPSAQSMGTEESIEEERRLLYVAATRAEQTLYLSALLNGRDRNSGYGNGVATLTPSCFLDEVDEFEELTEFKNISQDKGKAKFHKLNKWQSKKTKSDSKYLDSVMDYFSNY